MQRSRIVGITVGLVGGALGLVISAYFLFFFNPDQGVPLGGPPGAPPAPEGLPALAPHLDDHGAYMILASPRAQDQYGDAMAVARELHPCAVGAVFDPADPAAVLPELRAQSPRFALIFVLPDELDANVAWAWLRTVSQVDDDPFADVAAGWITGATPEDALAFMQRIRDAAGGATTLPARLVDHLAADPTADPAMFQQMPGSFFLPSFQGRLGVESVTCGVRGFGAERMGVLDGAGLLHFGGHGYPDQIVDTLNAAWVNRLALSPCAVFNGACYTGVTGRWFDMATGAIEEKQVQPGQSFCLAMLRNPVVAYFAALHADHGIPVYQEMEYLAASGAPLGEVIKHTHDGLVLANGGELPEFAGFVPGSVVQWTPSEFMLVGTGTRVLFGDPALILTPAFADQPFARAVSRDRDVMRVTFSLANPQFRSTYTDTYHGDLAADPNGFNDRALLSVPLPPEWNGGGARAEVVSATAGGNPTEFRLVGQAVERRGEEAELLVQVDFPTTGYMRSDFRGQGSVVELRVTRE